MAVVLLVVPWRSQAAPAHPGLPEPSYQPGIWIGVAQHGIAETAKAKQWVVAPAVAGTAWSGARASQDNPEPGVRMRQTVFGDAFFVSPPGAPAPYGYLPPLRVRTVGFGLLPAEATVQVSQRRADGLPIPVRAELYHETLTNEDLRGTETRVEDAFNVEVTRVLVDGVDVGLTGRCRTVRPAPVRLSAPAYVVPADQIPTMAEYLGTLDPATFYHPNFGGQLSGVLDIPPFTGCTTANGDDLSPMITLSVSGPGNRVTYRTSACDPPIEQGVPQPLPPGQYDPADLNCYLPLEPLPYPDRPAD